MDREGFLRKESPDTVRQLRRAERWIKELLTQGASIPEAVWAIQSTLSVALENVRYDLMQQKKRTTKRKRSP